MITIRLAKREDMKETLRIYRYYVEETAITFEYDVPSLEEFNQRFDHITSKYPYIVALKGNQIVGYAYAGTFKNRAAYDWSIETTIYVDHSMMKEGIGKALYQTLETILKEQGILNMNACISYPIVDDQYLNKNSVQYHEHLGFHLVGKFSQCGYKFNTWYDMVWMEKMIGEHLNHQPSIILYPDIKDILKEKHNLE